MKVEVAFGVDRAVWRIAVSREKLNFSMKRFRIKA